MKFILTFLIASSLTLALSSGSEELNISAKLSENGRSLKVTVRANESEIACDYSLLASASKAKLKNAPSTSTLLFEGSNLSSSLQISMRNLRPLARKTNGKSALYVLAQRSCGGTEFSSRILRILLQNAQAREGLSLPRWIAQLVKRVEAKHIQIVEAFPQLSFEHPVDLQSPADGSKQLFVVEQGGKLFSFSNSPDVSTKNLVLNISDAVAGESEQGLLGLAFHPKFKQNRFFYINYTRKSDGASVIARYSLKSDGSGQADPASALEILTLEQPFANHNGGALAFGPDGFLYIGFGDGGSGGDPLGHGQNRATLLGDMLRIDVDKTQTGKNYAVPAGNPFVGNQSDLREEIYAYGLRNPWRYSFDSQTGELWLADVGQNAREEVDIIEKGKNYGWNTMEGLLCYNPSSGCNKNGLALPVFDYGRDLGQSITGGYVYRGKSVSSLQGAYIFGDFISGRIWALRKKGSSYQAQQLALSGINISSFGVDQDNELYLLDYSNGEIHKFVAKTIS